MKVVIVGSGNVGTVLGKLIHKANHEIVQVLSRNENNAKKLASNFNCDWGTLESSPHKDADIYLLDCPLAALDAKVAQYVFKHAILQGLKGKTVIMSTHAMSYLPRADIVLQIDSGVLKEYPRELDTETEDVCQDEFVQTEKLLVLGKSKKEQVGIIKPEDRHLKLRRETFYS